MAEYINIRGQSIEVVASDPANPTIGQIWYNSTSNTLKGQVFQPAGWATGNNMNTARGSLAGAGLQTAALAFGGTILYPSRTGATEEYNGTNWATSPGSMNNARYALAGAGTQTAALAFGGTHPPEQSATEAYNGSTWTSVNSLPTQKSTLGGCGTQTAALAFGGNPGTGRVATTEEYDGTNWTAVNNLNTARSEMGSAGIQTAALAFGGEAAAVTGATEEYDGTSWVTSPGSLNTARRAIGSTVAGTQTAALGFSGILDPGSTAATEEYDGTSWTSVNPLNTTRNNLSGAGTVSAALAFGGNPVSAATEEYSPAGPVTKTITAS
jgi:hypothetical protein